MSVYVGRTTDAEQLAMEPRNDVYCYWPLEETAGASFTWGAKAKGRDA